MKTILLYACVHELCAIMSKRQSTSSTGEPNRKRSSFRFSRNPSDVVANSTKVGQLASGRIKQIKQNHISSSSLSMIAAQAAPLLQDEPIQLDDLNSTDAVQDDRHEAPEVLPKPKRKKRTNTTSVSKMPYDHHLI